MIPPRPVDDAARVIGLSKAGLFGTNMLHVRDDIERVAEQFHVPVAALTIIGKYFQHVKVSTGTDLVITNRDDAFCAYTILGDDVMVIEDASKDERFRLNPLVIHEPYIKFYAGAPIRTHAGYVVGALCLIDTQPRTLPARERASLIKSAREIEKNLA